MTRVFQQILTILAVSALTACASAGNAGADKKRATTADSQTQLAEAGQGRAEPSLKSAAKPKQNLPDVVLDRDLLFTLLTGEFAGYRGDFNLAAEQYLRAAKQTRDPRVIERAVRVASFARRFELGLEAAHMWVEVSPKLVKAHHTLASLLMRNKKYDEALNEFDFVIKQSTDDEKTFIGLGRQLSRETDRNAVLEVMQRLVARHDGKPAAHYMLSTLAEQAGKFTLAEKAVRKANELKPGWGAAQNQLARVLHLQGKVDEAIAYLEQALDADPNNTVLGMSYARLLVDAKELNKARAQFEKLAKLSPDNEDIIFALGILALQANDLESAERYLEQFAGKGRRSLEASYYLGQIAEQRKDFLKAIKRYTAVQHGEYAFDSRMRIAVLIAKQGDVDAAIESLHGSTVHGEAQSVRVILTEADILRDAKRFEDAMTVFNKALKTLPNNIDLLYARALMAERVDKLDILLADLKAILKQQPEHAHALNALGYTLADRIGNYEEALKYVSRALALLPDDPAVIDSMGWVQFRLGNYEVALKHLTRAYDLNPDAEIGAHLGEVLWVLGEQARARKVWNTSLEKSPEDERLLEVMERLTKNN